MPAISEKNAENQIHQMLSMHLGGMTYRAIGNHFGISGQRIQQLLAPDVATRGSVLALANYCCARCKKDIGLTGHVHHISTIVNVDEYNSIRNLEYLCQPCHQVKHIGPHKKSECNSVIETRIYRQCGTSRLKKEIETKTGQTLKSLIKKYYNETGTAHGVAEKLAKVMGKPISDGFVYYWAPKEGLHFGRKLIG